MRPKACRRDQNRAADAGRRRCAARLGDARDRKRRVLGRAGRASRPSTSASRRRGGPDQARHGPASRLCEPGEPVLRRGPCHRDGTLRERLHAPAASRWWTPAPACGPPGPADRRCRPPNVRTPRPRRRAHRRIAKSPYRDGIRRIRSGPPRRLHQVFGGRGQSRLIEQAGHCPLSVLAPRRRRLGSQSTRETASLGRSRRIVQPRRRDSNHEPRLTDAARMRDLGTRNGGNGSSVLTLPLRGTRVPMRLNKDAPSSAYGSGSDI